jgi:hypothetical protein
VCIWPLGSHLLVTFTKALPMGLSGPQSHHESRDHHYQHLTKRIRNMLQATQLGSAGRDSVGSASWRQVPGLGIQDLDLLSLEAEARKTCCEGGCSEVFSHRRVLQREYPWWQKSLCYLHSGPSQPTCYGLGKESSQPLIGLWLRCPESMTTLAPWTLSHMRPEKTPRLWPAFPGLSCLPI